MQSTYRDRANMVFMTCGHYDDIINYNYYDPLSINLIDWYKDKVFSLNGDDEREYLMMKKIDDSMYNYVCDYTYRRGIAKYFAKEGISFDNNDKVMRGIVNYNNYYEEEKVLNIKSNKWI